MFFSKLAYIETTMKYILLFLLGVINLNAYAQIPEGFVHVNAVIPDIRMDIRYCSDNNFVGEPIDGYFKATLILSEPATNALKNVQDELREQGLSLKVFDAYRPQTAVDHFVRWARELNDTIRKQQFYPDVEKQNLFKEGYIASRSRHSSGSTVDLTIVKIDTNHELDMGTPFDFFGPASGLEYSNLTEDQKSNRMLLHHIMIKHGFRHYPQEWWHFTLRNEPFKDQYFDFPVE